MLVEVEEASPLMMMVMAMMIVEMMIDMTMQQTNTWIIITVLVVLLLRWLLLVMLLLLLLWAVDSGDENVPKYNPYQKHNNDEMRLNNDYEQVVFGFIDESDAS